MGSKQPWCERAKSKQAEETITDKQAWSHASRMRVGGYLQVIPFSGFMGMSAAIVMLFIIKLFKQSDDPLEPGFWEVALPIWAVGMAVSVALFLATLAITLPGKRRMKRLLLPIRCQRCPKCFYDLSRRPRTDDTCPECGVIAPRRECVRLWCKLLRSRF